MPILPSLIATTTPNKKIEIGTRSSTGITHPPFEIILSPRNYINHIPLTIEQLQLKTGNSLAES